MRRWNGLRAAAAVVALGVLTFSTGCGSAATQPGAVGSPAAGAAPAPGASPSSSSSPSSVPCARRAGFTVYDNTAYTDVDLEQVCAVKSTVIYEGWVSALSGQRAPDQAKGELAIPPQAAYEDLIRRYAQNPGPIVLDFETLYLTGKPDVAQRHFVKLETLLNWAHAAAPGKVIGFYGVLGNTSPQYYALARQLARAEDAFFPTLYTHSDDRQKWQQTLTKDAAEAKAIDAAKPVYPYLWPQYHDGTPKGLQYLPADYWSFELDAAHRLCPGVVIWSGKGPSTDKSWLAATRQFQEAS